MKFILLSPKNRTAYNFRGDFIKELVSKGYEVVVTGPDHTDVEKIEALGARFAVIPLDKNGTSIFGDLRYCRLLTSFLRAEKPDAVMGYTVKPVVYGSIAAKRAGVQNVTALITGAGYTFISTSPKARILGMIVRRLYRIGLGKADHVIFQNRDDMQEFCQRKLVDPGKCSFVNGSGINLDDYRTVPLPENPAFFMLSRLLKSKGVREYLEAAERVKEKYPSIQFYLLGNYENSMQDAVEKEYVEGFIRRGLVRRFSETGDVRPFYRMCSVYVLPSYREGTPRTVLEAMAMGRPIITTDTQGCRETVREGVNGFLVPARNSDSVAEKMIWFIEHPHQIAAMGAESRRYAEEKFDVNRINEEMLRIMQI